MGFQALQHNVGREEHADVPARPKPVLLYWRRVVPPLPDCLILHGQLTRTSYAENGHAPGFGGCVLSGNRNLTIFQRRATFTHGIVFKVVGGASASRTFPAYLYRMTEQYAEKLLADLRGGHEESFPISYMLNGY